MPPAGPSARCDMQARMNTDARRRASAAYHAKREAEGLKKVTLWLSPEARFKLDALKATAGSKDKAANDAILAWEGPGGPKPQVVPPKPAKAAKVRVPKAEPVAPKPAPEPRFQPREDTYPAWMRKK